MSPLDSFNLLQPELHPGLSQSVQETTFNEELWRVARSPPSVKLKNIHRKRQSQHSFAHEREFVFYLVRSFWAWTPAALGQPGCFHPGTVFRLQSDACKTTAELRPCGGDVLRSFRSEVSASNCNNMFLRTFVRGHWHVH